MRVRMLVEIAGTINGQPWPERHGTIDLDPQVAEDLIANRYAEPAQAAETASVNPVAETASKPAGRPRKTSEG